MVDCPCCARPMLRHVRDHQVVWFCRHCWLEMPTAEKPHVLLLDPDEVHPHPSNSGETHSTREVEA